MSEIWYVIARNNLRIPINLTVGTHGNSISIAVSEQKLTKDPYPNCHAKANLESNMETWKRIGEMTVEATQYHLKMESKLELLEDVKSK